MNSRNLSIITTCEQFDQLPQKQDKRRVQYFTPCGHKNEILWRTLLHSNDSGLQCSTCRNVYDNIVRIMELREMHLITTREEFDQQQVRHSCYKKIQYIATCDHQTISDYQTLQLSENEGLYCKKCRIENVRYLLSNQSINPSNIENQGFQFLANIIQNDYDIIQGSEGSKIDMMIKRKDSNKGPGSLYLKIQLKVTQSFNQKYKRYTFCRCQGYDDIVIILICLQDTKLWILTGNEVQSQRIQIRNGQRSYYNQYLVSVEDIVSELDQLSLNQSLLDTVDGIQRFNPKSYQYQQTNKYIMLRQNKLDFIQFKNSQIQNTATDFLVNDIKFQEKVSSTQSRKQTIYRFHFFKHKNGIQVSYEYNDNDFYWFNIDNPTQQIFYVIPQQQLIYHNYISHESNIKKKQKKTIRLCSDIDQSIRNDLKWVFEYRFDYNNIDQVKLLDLIYKKENNQ